MTNAVSVLLIKDEQGGSSLCAGIAPNTMTKLRRDEAVKLGILEKICFSLNVDIGDIMEFLPED